MSFAATCRFAMAASPAWAQGQPPANDMQALRAAVKADKKGLVTKTLDLTPAERAVFEAAVERAKNELATTQAEAAKKIAEAEGDAKSAVTRAQGEADANRIRQNSLTPQLLELRRLENQQALIGKWNGQLPTVEASEKGALMLQLPRQ